MITKPQTSDYVPRVAVTLGNNSVEVRNCKDHPEDSQIRVSLASCGWLIRQIRGDGYNVTSEYQQSQRNLMNLMLDIKEMYR